MNKLLVGLLVMLGVMLALIELKGEVSPGHFWMIFISSAAFGIAAGMVYGGGV